MMIILDDPLGFYFEIHFEKSGLRFLENELWTLEFVCSGPKVPENSV